MSIVPEQEAQNFDRQVITFWSRLMHRDIASPLFFYLPSLVDLSGICCSTTCGCPMACVAVDHSFIDVYNPISGHRFTFSFNTTTTCPTHSTSIHPLPTNEQTFLPAQTALTEHFRTGGDTTLEASEAVPTQSTLGHAFAEPWDHSGATRRWRSSPCRCQRRTS